MYVCVVTVPFCGNKLTCRKGPTISGTNRTLSIPAEGQGPGKSNGEHAAADTRHMLYSCRQCDLHTQLLPVGDHEVIHDNSHVSTPVVRDE